MDLVAACRAFVSVADRSSFTLGAAAIGVAQSVASRRIAALEERLGAELIDRSAGHALVTPFGADVLPAATRLVEDAAGLFETAAQASRRALSVGVPDTWPMLSHARLVAEATAGGVRIALEAAAPTRRVDGVKNGQLRAALVPVPPAEAEWSVPLGAATVRAGSPGALFLDSLRSGRSDTGLRKRLWLQPEDDVPHVRDRLFRLRDRLALGPAQVAVADGAAAAVAACLASDDLLLCSAREASDWGLRWQALADLHLVRGYAISAPLTSDGGLVRTTLGAGITQALGLDRDGNGNVA